MRFLVRSIIRGDVRVRRKRTVRTPRAGFSLPEAPGVQRDPQDYRGKILIVDFMQVTLRALRRVQRDSGSRPGEVRR